MEPIFTLLWFAMLGGSAWGAVVLARKWVANPWARFFLGALLCVVFWIAGTTAVISGCVAVVGSPNFH